MLFGMSNINKKLFDLAKNYRDERGWSVIPIGITKKRPPISWEKYQKEYATDADFEHWFLRNGWGLGIATGALSNLLVVDYDHNRGMSAEDNDKAVRRLLSSLEGNVMARTPSGGLHVYYKYFDGIRNGQKLGQVHGLHVDIRGEGDWWWRHRRIIRRKRHHIRS